MRVGSDKGVFGNYWRFETLELLVLDILYENYKLDEFPQLINVFLGEMSLVGPRPEVRHYVNYWTEEQMHVLDVRPGITDPASIKFRNENELMEKQKILRTIIST